MRDRRWCFITAALGICNAGLMRGTSIFLKDHFRLILFDARGHGASDKPHDASAYIYERWVGDVVALLDHLDVERAHFFGYSHGAFVGYRMLKFAPERVHSLVVGGGLPHQMYDHYHQQYETFKDGLEGVIRKREEAGRPLSDAELTQMQGMDLEVVAAAGLALQDEPSVADLLPQSVIPILAFAGADDQLIDPIHNLAPLAMQIPDGEVILLSGLDHGTAFRQSERVVPQVLAFLERVERDGKRASDRNAVTR